MASRVVFSFPSGHRVTVSSTSLNESLMSLLERACLKRKLDPSNFSLESKSTKLQLDLPLRFANLDNRALIDVVPKSHSNENAPQQNVELTVQLLSGKRVQSNWPIDTSLATILDSVGDDAVDEDVGKDDDIDKDSQLGVLFLRQEVVGQEQLRCTSLRAMGILGHKRELIRIIRRNEAQIQQALTEGARSVSVVSMKKKAEESGRNVNFRPMRVETNTLQSLLAKEKSSEEGQLQGKEGPVGAGPKEQQRDGECKEQEPGLQVREEDAMEVEAEKPTKTSTTKSVECEELQSKPKLDLSCGSRCKKDEGIVLNVLGDNEAIVFDLTDYEQVSNIAFKEEDDSFYELSSDEVLRLYKERLRESKQIQEDSDNRLLTTKAYKTLQDEAAKLQRLNQFKHSIIRVRFVDGHVFQAVFSPAQTIGHLKQLLREFITNGKEVEFNLFVTPPKQVLSDAKQTLIDAGLVPSALLHFEAISGFEGEPMLRADVIAKKSNIAGVNHLMHLIESGRK